MFLVFDIGGTHTRISLSKDCEEFEQLQIYDTPEKFDDGLKLFRDFISKHSDIKLQKAAGGIRGALDREKMKTHDPVKLPDWSGKPLVKELGRILNTQIYLENDADLVGLGEATRGAGQGFGIVVYLTVSTGVGGVRIVDGRIDSAAFGFEPGKQIINMDGAPGLKTLEEHISGNAIEEMFGKKPKEVDKDFYQDASRILAIGLHNTIIHWSPEVVVLGGGIMNDIELTLVQQQLEEVAIFPELPKLKKAKLKDKGGLYGALALLKQHG